MIATPYELIGRPFRVARMTDVLSDVLRSIRLRGGVFLDARFTAPWAVNSELTIDDCRPLLSRPSHLIAYHMLIEGELLLATDGEAITHVRAGEIVLLPRADPHVLSSAPGLPVVDGRSLIEPSPEGGLAKIDHGGGGAATRIICGFLGCDDIYNPLLATLPRVLTVDMRTAASKDLVETSLRFAVNELVAGRLADSSVLSRLSELLLIEAVRCYSEDCGAAQSGWLRGLKDPNIARALALIHRDITAPWTAESLAKDVAMSRSAFMERFTALVGQPPIRYLTTWRMDTAKIQLRETTKSIAQVAYAVGYESEEAFSRAFKREVGLSPSPWRAQQTGQ
jgi:AraC-like DNA-binding protein